MMATYFHGGSEIQPGDNLQTLYLMNPNYVAAYTSEAHNNNPAGAAVAASQPPPNMLLLNPSAGLSPGGGGLQSPQQQQPGHQQFIGIPLAGPHSENPGRPSHHHHHHHQISGGSSQLHGVAVSRVHYNLWSPAADPSPNHPGSIPTAMVAASAGAQGGLSLSLSPQQQNNNNNPVGMGGGGDDGRMSVTVVGGSSSVVSNGGGGGGVQGVILGSKYLKAAQELLDEVVNVETYCSNNKNGNNNGGGDSGESSGAHKDKAKAVADKETGVGEGSSDDGGKKAAAAEQLTTAQRQELQMKKAKLLNMLDEVEQRYRQYHTQMQLVVSSFEQAAGMGSAKSYTSLALQTISRQFRCLKDAIVSQIRATSKSLGEEDASGGGSKLDGGAGGVGSRLRFVDHQLRQQRALQQLGMMQHNAWRPQRGLPERAVSVLRAWLFEHFLHPYPKDSDKHMLAKQTGLTRSQVSNWFINARVRLWKPMVEEMYVEEMKSQEQNGGNSENNNNNNNNANNNGGNPAGNEPTSKATGAPQQQQQQQHQQNEQRHDGGNGGLIQAHHQQGDQQHQTTNDMISNLSAMSTTSMSSQGFTLIGSSSDMESLMARSPKKQRSMQSSPSSILSMDMEMKPPDHHHHPHQRQSPMIISNHHHHQAGGGGGGAGGGGAGGFNPYMVNDMGRFNPDQLITAHHHHQQYQGGSNNGAVSLTLGLPHCENQTLSLSGNHQQNFIPNQQGMQLARRLDIGAAEDQGTDFCGISMGMGQPSHPNNGYEAIDIQSRKRFAAHQLLHDFVA